MLRFTVPEALALVEQVSRRMRPLVADSIPLGDQLTVAQVMKLYRWRSAIDMATRAYDLWRIVRLFNPLSAATHELREQFSKKMYELGKDALARRLGRVYVREVGRAALDLYGGRLRVTAEVLETHVSQATHADRGEMAARRPEPLRLLVLGQTSVGKSSLVNALLRETRALVDALPATGEFTPYELTQNGLDRALLIDTPGLGAGPTSTAFWTRRWTPTSCSGCARRRARTARRTASPCRPSANASTRASTAGARRCSRCSPTSTGCARSRSGLRPTI